MFCRSRVLFRCHSAFGFGKQTLCTPLKSYRQCCWECACCSGFWDTWTKGTWLAWKWCAGCVRPLYIACKELYPSSRCTTSRGSFVWSLNSAMSTFLEFSLERFEVQVWPNRTIRSVHRINREVIFEGRPFCCMAIENPHRMLILPAVAWCMDSGN